MPFDKIWLIAITGEQLCQLGIGHARQHRRICDFVTVQMQDGKHRAVARRIQELVRVPARGQRPGFRFAVAHDAADQQVRIVENRAVGVRDANIPARRLRESSREFPGATWLGMPPGKENCLKSFRMPSSSA